MKYYIGIDGGGTKTKAVLTDENLTVIGEEIGNASNFLVFDLQDVAKSVYNLINKVCTKTNINRNEVEAILIGTAGAGRKEDARKLVKATLDFAKSQNSILNNFYVESDARIALEGAFSGKIGSILIAGTGSIMFGKDYNNNIHRVGGFGRILGDEGSGFHIGRSGLNAGAKEFDGRGENTSITSLLKSKFNISSSEQLISEIYKNNFDIPQVAPLVIEAAENGDETCINILNFEIKELIKHISAMREKLETKILPLSLIGGTITTDNFYAKLFKKEVYKLGNVKLSNPELPPEMGAILLAQNYKK